MGYDAHVPAIAAASAAPAGAGPLFSAARGEDTSGPVAAQLFQRVLALIMLLAWLSLLSQLQLLIGSHGLLPAAEFFERARAAGAGFWDEPTLFWIAHSDPTLTTGAFFGVFLALLAALGRRPRLCFGASAALYLSYAIVCSDFGAFQWDNLLIETAALAAFLPAQRRSGLAHFAFRALLFKLYFESGIAKWQSQLHDWQDGSAMSFYYETAPIPARLAWYAHQLPAGWHRLESWGALALELVVPWLIWGPRRARLFACIAFTGFQLVNTATANYGFFTYLATALHLFLLSDADLARPLALAAPFLPRLEPPTRANVAPARRRKLAAFGLLAAWLSASSLAALIAFASVPARDRGFEEVHALYAPFRVANVYHLFGHITRERIEPQFETRVNGDWLEHDLWYKPGNVQRPPPYVAPHQPRVDFQLWFYGLSFRRGMPAYVARLLEQLCAAPQRVQALFVARLPPAPDAVRIAFYRYRFTTSQERSQSGAYFERTRLGALGPRSCR